MIERAIHLLGAPTNLGLEPYDEGGPRRVDEAPSVLRRLGLLEELGARDLGDVAAAPYTDLERPENGIRNGPLLATHAAELADAVATAVAPDALESAFSFSGGVPRELLFYHPGSVVVSDHRDDGSRITENAHFLHRARSVMP